MNRNSARSIYLVCAALVSITLAVFWPLLHFAFIGYDDPEYVTRNPHVLAGVTLENLRWAFVTFHASNWHPFTWFSHMLDAQFFGAHPGLHHLTNLLFHAVNACLLFLLLRRLSGSLWRSSIVAALFAVHPMHVESVAWISERKDVLSGFFFMLTLLAYAAYAKSKQSSVISDQSFGKPSPKRSTPHAPRSLTLYALTLLCFALGLMSKPMLVTLPFVLLLLDFWPLGRIGILTTECAAYIETRKAGPRPNFQPATFNLQLFRRCFVEKLPFFALSATSSVITFLAQRHGGAVETLEHLSLSSRMANAVVAYLGYLEKLFWPANLAVLYLRPDHWPKALIALGILLLGSMSIILAWKARKRPYVFLGWFWFLGMLIPVIGLVQVGNQFMADRYTYLPYIGLFIMLVWTGADLLARVSLPKTVSAALVLGVIGLAAVTARRQVLFWNDSETLFGHCLAITKNNFVAHNILGASLDPKIRFADAKAHFLAALQIQPGYVDSLSNLGVLLTDHGDYDEAVGYLKQAVQIRPSVAPIYAKLAFALDLQGRTDPAIAYYREALRLLPDDLQTANNLAWILATNPRSELRNGAEAVRLAEHASELTAYQQAPLLGTLAAAYAEAGRFNDAISTAQKAIALADAAGDKVIAQKNRQLVQLYQSGKPYRDQPAVKPP